MSEFTKKSWFERADDGLTLENAALEMMDTLEWECEWAGDCESRTEQ